MSKSKAQILLGLLLSCKVDPKAILKELSSGLASNDDQLIFTHARTLVLSGMQPIPSAIVESMKSEPWAASVIVSSIHSYMNHLVSMARELNVESNPADVAISMLLTGEHYSSAFIEQLVPIEYLKSWFNPRNVDFHQCDGQVWLTSKSKDI